MPKTITIRLQVDIPKHQLEELEELRKLGGLRSKRELWDEAFTVLKWAARKRAQGSSIGSKSEDGAYTELEMHFLEHYARSVRGEHSLNGSRNVVSKQKERRVIGPNADRNGGKMSLAKRRQTA